MERLLDPVRLCPQRHAKAAVRRVALPPQLGRPELMVMAPGTNVMRSLGSVENLAHLVKVRHRDIVRIDRALVRSAASGDRMMRQHVEVGLRVTLGWLQVLIE